MRNQFVQEQSGAELNLALVEDEAKRGSEGKAQRTTGLEANDDESDDESDDEIDAEEEEHCARTGHMRRDAGDDAGVALQSVRVRVVLDLYELIVESQPPGDRLKELTAFTTLSDVISTAGGASVADLGRWAQEEHLRYNDEEGALEAPFAHVRPSFVLAPSATAAAADHDGNAAFTLLPMMYTPATPRDPGVGPPLPTRTRQNRELRLAALGLLYAQALAVEVLDELDASRVAAHQVFDAHRVEVFDALSLLCAKAQHSKKAALDRWSERAFAKDSASAAEAADVVFKSELERLMNGEQANPELLKDVAKILDQFPVARRLMVSIAGGCRTRKPSAQGSRVWYEKRREKRREQGDVPRRSGERDFMADLSVLPYMWLVSIRKARKTKHFRLWHGLAFRSMGMQQHTLEDLAKIKLVASRHDLDNFESGYATNIEERALRLSLDMYERGGSTACDIDNASITQLMKLQGVDRSTAHVIHFTCRMVMFLDVTEFYPSATNELGGFLCINGEAPYCGHAFIEIASGAKSPDLLHNAVCLPELVSEPVIMEQQVPTATNEKLRMVAVNRFIADDSRITFKAGSKKSGKSGDRYDKYKVAKTCSGVLSLGGSKADLQFDLEKGIATLVSGDWRSDARFTSLRSDVVPSPTRYRAELAGSTPTSPHVILESVIIAGIASVMTALPEAAFPSTEISTWSGTTLQVLHDFDLGDVPADVDLGRIASTAEMATFLTRLMLTELKSKVLSLGLVELPAGVELSTRTRSDDFFRATIKTINPFGNRATPVLRLPASAYSELSVPGKAQIESETYPLMTPHRDGRPRGETDKHARACCGDSSRGASKGGGRKTRSTKYSASRSSASR